MKLLVEFAQRTQKSVFEAQDLSPALYLRLRSRAERVVNLDTDTLRYYRLCAACAARVEHAGAGPGVLSSQEEFLMLDGE